MSAWYEEWPGHPPSIAFEITSDLIGRWRGAFGRWHPEHEVRERHVLYARRDLSRVVEEAIRRGVVFPTEVREAVAAVWVAEAWAEAGWYTDEEADALLAEVAP